jgi:hypothetical protein
MSLTAQEQGPKVAARPLWPWILPIPSSLYESAQDGVTVCHILADPIRDKDFVSQMLEYKVKVDFS